MCPSCARRSAQVLHLGSASGPGTARFYWEFRLSWAARTGDQRSLERRSSVPTASRFLTRAGLGQRFSRTLADGTWELAVQTHHCQKGKISGCWRAPKARGHRLGAMLLIVARPKTGQAGGSVHASLPNQATRECGPRLAAGGYPSPGGPFFKKERSVFVGNRVFMVYGLC